eukprot:TRINITY_DN56053_c0_g1_i1.p1 TRINITY_DN56053_c0_g1~~TRINITY_DN56053_c0_g1_i1.p1  ORF type:complete len:337 (-),score=40.95 TRINITY_DN56053_c0_g1_i1:38-1048(-)
MAAALGIVATASASSYCWQDCRRTGFYCPEFCCQPPDVGGNPTCWDDSDHFTFERCCQDVVIAEEPSEPPRLRLGGVSFPLYRGPSTYNSPRFNERTVEVALGIWFMHRSLLDVRMTGRNTCVVEIGSVLESYWPSRARINRRILPWAVLDVGDTGIDVTGVRSFHFCRLLSISTVEHVGIDNQGLKSVDRYLMPADDDSSLETWVRSWDAAPALLSKLASEAVEFLITFPIGFNPRLDAAVQRTPSLRNFARVARRKDAANTWEIVHNGSLAYHYDFRDMYDPNFVGLIYDKRVPAIYKRVFGEEMLPLLPLPAHPRFRFANAICIFTNVRELLL